MIMSVLAIGVIGLVGYIWVLRGFFSAFIHLLCTLAAGAVAFASFETVAHWLLNSAPTSGMGAMLGDSAFAIGLSVPFAVSLVVFRIAIDSMLRANLKFKPVADYIGGGICGAGAGIITAGILVLSMGFMRLDPEIMGYQPIQQTNQGNLERSGGLLLPVDKLTVRLYGHLSRNAMYFSDEDQLARTYPDLHEMPGVMRMSSFEGNARNTVRSSDVEVIGRYSIGEGANLPVDQLLTDIWNSAPQRVSDLDKTPYTTGSYLTGFSVRFKSGAKERGGDNKILFTNAQLWLVVEDNAGETSKVVHPVAAAGQAEAAAPTRMRFRFDAQETPVASTGGASDATFDIDFVVPANHKPTALFVKGVRYSLIEGKLATMAPTKYRTTAERDAWISGGAATTLTLDRGSAVSVGGTPSGPNQIAQVPGLRVANFVGQMLSKTILRTIDVDENNRISDGQQTLTADDLRVTSLEKPLRVEQFAVTPDTVIVQLDVGPSSAMSLLGEVAKTAEEIAPLRLIDSNNVSYEPVGFIHDDAIKNQKTIRFTPSDPVRALRQVPSLSRSRPDDKLVLIFRVSFGVTLKEFAIGNKTVATFPDVKLDQPQGSR